MRKMPFLVSLLVLLLVVLSSATGQRPRVVVLTDISNEPDDEESLVRFLVYSNEFDVEGLTATTSTHLKNRTREDLIRRQIGAFALVRDNLTKHASGYPTADALRAVTKTGQGGYGMAAVGEGKSTPGSKHLIQVVDRAHERPVWVTIWGGANTLAQALWDVNETRDAAAVDAFVGKLRVYTISDQDDAGPWLRETFPSLFYIVSPGSDYGRSTWNGIAGDRMRKTGVMHHFEMVDNPWLEENIIQNHGPLGALYPRVEYIMEGDTPSFLGLVNNGLGWHVRPDYGGWGGRYELSQPAGEPRPIWTDTADTVTSDENGRMETSGGATIRRWREHFQNDFAARMDWCVADDFLSANHNPLAVLNGDRTKNVLEIAATPGETVHFTAEGSSDPDGDGLGYRWWIYEEAGTLRDPETGRLPEDVQLVSGEGPTTSLATPHDVREPYTIHIILELRDDGKPNLWSYRRAVVKIEPAGGSAALKDSKQAGE